MSVGRLRRGELVALLGAVGLLVVLFLDWFGVDVSNTAEVQRYRDADITDLARGINAMLSAHVHHSGWSTLGWFLDVLLVVSIAGGLTLAYVTVTRAAPAWPVGASILTIAIGGITFLVLLLRVVTQPGLGPGLPNDVVTVQLPAYLGLLFAALIPAGAWMALADERTDAPESAYTPPPARPIPGT